MRMCISCSHL